MQLTFLGAAMTVTGSSYLIETKGKKILVDCGMFQGSKTMEAMNRRNFLYDPTSLDCVLLTHAHIDHSGLLPKLCKSGFKGPIYTTKITKEFCHIMLPDSAHIQEFDAEIANRKGQRAGREPVEPLYSVADSYDCLQQFRGVEYDTDLMLGDHVRVRFQQAGHILGSSMVEIWVEEEGETVKLLFSGDIGQPDQPMVKDPKMVEQANFVIMESTYGNRLHEQYDKETRLAEIVNEIIAQGGNLIIPSFAVGRTQTILYHLNQLFKSKRVPRIPVIIDSPLAIAATDIFMKNPQEYGEDAAEMLLAKENPLEMPNLMFARSSDESRAINNMTEPAIIISASGMADAGRVLHHLKHNLWRENSGVLFVGYQAQGSLGRRLLEGARRVKIMGEEIGVRSRIYNMDGFSAHADQQQMLDWLAHFKVKPDNVFVVHGEHDMSEPFARLLQEKLALTTYIPRFGDMVKIVGVDWHVEQMDTTVAVEPTMIQLHNYLAQFEREYMAYRKQVEKAVSGDSAKMAEAVRRLDKIKAFIQKNLSDL